MSRFSETESGAYMQRAENGFIVEVVQIEEREIDPSMLVEAGEPEAMGAIRAQGMPKTRTPVSKVFVYTSIKDALKKLEEYFDE